MTDVHAILNKLEGVISRGNDSWYAKCPAHNDKSPSLSIRDTGEKILFHCFAGCGADDVLAAISLSFRDLYDDQKAANESAFCVGGKLAAKRLHNIDPLETERLILDMAVTDIREGRQLTLEDRARIQLAIARIRATGGGHGR